MTKSGLYNKTEVYFYDGQRICQINNGSGAMVQQFIHGTQYIDELVMMRVAAKGDLYVHQDANWNVIGTTDLGRHVVERNVYTPYGELTVHQDTGFGDRDGDQDVDATDKGTVGTTCTGTVSGTCRILDLDFDGDYDSTDATKFDALTQGAQRHPGRPATATSQPFAHQGLFFEPELAQYQNRHRQYDPGKRRFGQTDPYAFLASPRFAPGRHYQDGLDLYGYLQQRPMALLDPYGLGSGECCNNTNSDLQTRPEQGCTNDRRPGPGAIDGCDPGGYYPLPPSSCMGCDGAKDSNTPNGKIHKITNGCRLTPTGGGGFSQFCEGTLDACYCMLACGLTDEWWH